MNRKNDGKVPPEGSELATLAGGCFWCLESVFREVKGVETVVSGYAGGTTVNPSYAQVCSGSTGQAESVQVTYDPKVVSYREILAIFFAVHDPTTLNRQGADVGTQYRSVIFYHNEQQKGDAEEAVKQLDASGDWGAPVVTHVEPLQNFFPAEEYHQNYYNKNPEQPYCSLVIAPKLDKFRKQFLKKDQKSGAKS
jgi:peptide-methionine (S)-S-oxide reductase